MSLGKRIKVRTTLPFPLPPIGSWDDLETSRLIIRAPRISDVVALHALRTQPEVMKFSMDGRIDRDLEETRSKLETLLLPNDTSSYNFFIFNKKTGDLIGTGGVRNRAHWFGWPEVGYSLKREAWGQGYATEFLTAFLDNWWRLPRRQAVLEVDAKSIQRVEGEANDSIVLEQLCAMVEADNVPSRKVMEKCKFHSFKEWIQVDDREGFNEREVLLIGYGLLHPTHTKT